MNNKKTTLMEDIIRLLIKVTVICVIFVLIFTFIFGIYRAEDDSMKPAIMEGDLVIYFRLDKNYVATDALLIEHEGKKQVRRIVAKEGDIIDVSEEGLIINGALVQEQYIYHKTLPYVEGIKYPYTIQKNQVFILGDNRPYSYDSRIYGSVDANDSEGKIMAVIRRRNI